MGVGRLHGRAEYGKVRTNGKGREERRKEVVWDGWEILVDEVKSGVVLTAERGDHT